MLITETGHLFKERNFLEFCVGYKLESVGGLLPPGEESWLKNKTNAEQTNKEAEAEQFTSWEHLDPSVPAVFSVTRSN